jgi:hypothetical protein
VLRDTPYNEVNTFDIVKHVALDKKRPIIPSSCHPQLTNLIERCWAPSPGDRPSFTEILNILYSIKDLETDEEYSEMTQRLSEAALLKVCDYLDLRDLYGASQVCRGWYLLVDGKISEIGLQRKRIVRHNTDWKTTLIQRHSAKPTRSKTLPPITGSTEPKDIKIISSPNRVSMPNLPSNKEDNNSKPQQNSVIAAVNRTLGVKENGSILSSSPTGNKGTLTSQTVKHFEKELSELRHMLEEQKKINEDLVRFKKKYEEQARKRRLEKSNKDLDGSSDSSAYEVDGDGEEDDDEVIVLD